MKFGKIFVTVGTTEFNQLISKISEPETYQLLKNEIECEKLTLQIGRGEETPLDSFPNIEIEIFRLKDSISDEIESADLVISHAGAGTCIDVLSRGKPLIVVINESLMNNHQVELAEQLSSQNYLVHTTVEKLTETLRSFDTTKLKKYEKGNIDKFITYLDDAMGFAN